MENKFNWGGGKISYTKKHTPYSVFGLIAYSRSNSGKFTIYK